MHLLFVEKKPAHRHDARRLLHDLRESLDLPQLDRYPKNHKIH